MKALIAGAGGQLGRELIRSVPPGVQFVSCDRATLDLTDATAVERCIESHAPAVLINAAAYTAVDLAESDSAKAFAVNADAVETLARSCRARGIRMIHVSTDFVFDGTSGRPYRTDDSPNPLSVYGASKLAGEQRLANCEGLDWRVIRTSWVYASHGRNFMLTMLRLFRERPVVRVVADQVGTPTSAISLAQCLWAAARDQGPSAMLHFSDAGVASWYDFAVAIYEEARALGIVEQPVDIVPIRTVDYPTPAKRPSYSVLDSTASKERLQLPSTHWRTALRTVLQELRT